MTIHKVQNAKEKSIHTVKFDDENSYHEYRSRHKHTPPTKDTPSIKINDKTYEDDSNDNVSRSCSTSDASTSRENLNEEKLCHTESNNEKIIIYKILETKNDPSNIKKSKSRKHNIRYLNANEKEIHKCHEEKDMPEEKLQKSSTIDSLEQVNEGISYM